MEWAHDRERASALPVHEPGLRTAFTATRVAIGNHPLLDHLARDGIMVPTKRRVYAIDTDGTVNRELMLVSIDLDQIKFESTPVASSLLSRDSA
ncbi:MAG: hypothetical protein JWM18_573 [Chloroflexi bacterium]|jgi:hypothetical protein|nr:hypothetical protein [Chloroflexota bacterium]